MSSPGDLTEVPYGLVLNRFPYPATLTDRDNRFVFANESFVQRFGYLSRDLIGLTPRVLIPRQSPKRMLESYTEHVLRRHSRWEGELLNRRRDNEVFRVHLSVFPLRLNEGAAPVAFLGVTCEPEERVEMLLELVHLFSDQWFQNSLQRALPTLTGSNGNGAPRQSAILKLCRMGFSTKEIAHIMGVSPSTVGVVRWRLRTRPAPKRKR
jgi:PAS domain S-box-containing protein